MSAQKKEDPTILVLLRGTVRPFLALSCWTATIVFLTTGTNVPDAWWALVGAVSTFYFVHRHEEKEREEKKAGLPGVSA